MKGFVGFLLATAAVSTGVFLMRGGKLPRLSGARGRRRGGLRGDIESTELKLFIDNDGDLYRQQTTSIMKNLATKLAKGIYDRDKAEKLWMYLAESGAKKYTRDNDAPGAKWHDVFSMADRKAVAKELNDDFLEEWKNGSYDHLLPKKYARVPQR